MNKFKLVTNIMLNMGIEFDDGLEYLRESVLMVINKPLLSSKKERYPSLARIYGTKSTSVERCVRTTTEKTIKRNNLDKMSNLRFIRYLANEARMILSEEEDGSNV